MVFKSWFLAVSALLLSAAIASGASNIEVQKRIDVDLAGNSPIVVHVVVALCDNKHQGIVPVPKALGNGQNPGTNLYWGAAFGFKTYLTRKAKYTVLAEHDQPEKGVLKRVLLHKKIQRTGVRRDVFVVGEAWDGRQMKSAVNRFLTMAAGRKSRVETVELNGKTVEFTSGGSSALVVFVGHNGLMDFFLGSVPRQAEHAPARSSVVLACASKPYFLNSLLIGGSHPLLLTTNLMAPEAYTLDAVISAFVQGRSPSDVRDAAAAAYHKYQKCGLGGARRLFWSSD